MSVVYSSYALRLKKANKSSLSTTGALGYDRLCSAVCQILDTPPLTCHSWRQITVLQTTKRDTHILSVQQKNKVFAKY